LTRRILHSRSLVVAAAAASLAFGSAFAAETGAVASASVTVPIAVIELHAHLRFGRFITRAGGQSITVHPDGGRTVRGVHPVDLHQTARFGPAEFRVTSGSELGFSIGLPRDAVLTTRSASHPRELLQVTGFQISPANVGVLGRRVQTVRLGATVTTVDDQAPGDYRGFFSLTLSYE
jgi:hypothetical protein